MSRTKKIIFFEKLARTRGRTHHDDDVVDPYLFFTSLVNARNIATVTFCGGATAADDGDGDTVAEPRIRESICVLSVALVFLLDEGERVSSPPLGYEAGVGEGGPVSPAAGRSCEDVMVFGRLALALDLYVIGSKKVRRVGYKKTYRISSITLSTPSSSSSPLPLFSLSLGDGTGGGGGGGVGVGFRNSLSRFCNSLSCFCFHAICIFPRYSDDNAFPNDAKAASSSRIGTSYFFFSSAPTCLSVAMTTSSSTCWMNARTGNTVSSKKNNPEIMLKRQNAQYN